MITLAPRLIAPVVAVLALTLSAIPHGTAAQEIGIVGVTVEDAAPQDPVLLRQLLSNPERTAQQQDLLDRSMDGIYEELADASQPQKQKQGLIDQVNELLGVKTKASS